LVINVTGTGLSSSTSGTCTSSAFSIPITFSSGDGVKNITLTETDAATNTTSVNMTITVDTVPPALSFGSSSVQTQVTATNKATFSGSCEAGLTVVVSGTDTSSTTCTSGSWSYTTATQTTDAARTYNFAQTDLAGNTTTISGSWQRLATPPGLTLTSPANNTSAQTGVTMAGACQTGLSITFAGSGLASSFQIACPSGTYSQFANFTDGDGTKTITVSQTNQVNNTTTQTGTYTRDTTSPAISETLHASPYYTNTNTAGFGGNCEAGLSIVISGADTTTIGCPVSGAWTFTTGAQTVDGSYSYTFTQTDAAGNVGSVGVVWDRLTTAPAFTFLSSSSFSTSTNSVVFNGNCLSGSAIAVTGSATASSTCSGGQWSYTASSAVDGNFSYTFTETDVAGNTATLTGTWVRSTVGPIITVNQATPVITSTNQTTFTGTCTTAAGAITVSGSDSTTTSCTGGAWSYTTVSQTTDAARTYNFAQTSGGHTSSISITWDRDTTAPVVSTFKINGATTTSTTTAYNSVSFNVTDNLTTTTEFCLKTTNSAPASTDSCWYPVNGSETNVTPSNSESISGYQFNLGVAPQTYSVYLWAMDGAGNISTLSNSGAGTLGKDLVTITLSHLAAPSISTLLVANSDTMNGTVAERTITADQNVYIRWTASGNLGSTPISITATDGTSNWTVATGLANGQNNCASVTGSGSASTSSTGCYLWTNGSPTSSYYMVRASVTDNNSQVSYASSLPINASNINILAGNTDTGLGGSATAAMLQAAYGYANWGDAQNLVINSTGTIYFRDVTNGLVAVNPNTGLIKQIVALGATTSGYGDGGSVSNALLRFPAAIGIDGRDRIYIYDYDRIFPPIRRSLQPLWAGDCCRQIRFQLQPA
jgi:hypothetical protein